MADQSEWPERGNEMISRDVAFSAMIAFLDEYWATRDFAPGDLGDLIAGIRRHRSGTPGDPGEWSRWMDCLDEQGWGGKH